MEASYPGYISYYLAQLLWELPLEPYAVGWLPRSVVWRYLLGESIRMQFLGSLTPCSAPVGGAATGSPLWLLR